MLKCKQFELFETPTWLSDILYSNNDGGHEGVLYRYVRWVESLTERNYYTRNERKMWQGAKPIHEEHIKELMNIPEPEFYLDH